MTAPTTEQLERMVVEVTLGFTKQDSLLPMDDPDMIAAWDRLVREIAALREQGLVVDTAPEIPEVVVVPDGWAETQPRP